MASHTCLFPNGFSSLSTCRQSPRQGTLIRSKVDAEKEINGNSRRSVLLLSSSTLLSSVFNRDELALATGFVDSSSSFLPSNITSFTLPNGMQWIVGVRPNAPIVSCRVHANVGAADEEDGQTGVAHLLEHMAFKGTKQIGTKNYEKEQQILNQLDELFYERRAAIDAGNGSLIKRLTEEMDRAQLQASDLVVPNEYGSILSRQGGVGLNAQTSQDSTVYFVSLPANKLELWMALESDRFQDPVFRQLYMEKEVVKEERRLRVDNAPLGRFTEQFARVAFPVSPYGRPIIGYPDDLERIGRREVESFYRERYTPSSLTCAVVGDVDPLQVERLALKYFGSWSNASYSPPLEAPSGAGWDSMAGLTPSTSTTQLRMRLPAGPFFMEGYHRPAETCSDSAAMSVLSQVLSGSRTSRFYKNLIVPGKLLSASAVDNYPGEKRPSLCLLYGIPSTGESSDSAAAAISGEIQQLLKHGVSNDELAPIKKMARVGLLEAFGSNDGMARLLTRYQALSGSWSSIWEENNRIQSLTCDDVNTVAHLLFNPSRVVQGFVDK